MKRSDLELLADYARGLASPEESALLEQRLPNEESLRLALEGFRAASRHGSSVRELDPAWINRAKALLPSMPSRQASSLAQLVWDSLSAPVLGVRSAAAVRELQYKHESEVLDLRIEPSAGGRALAGVLICENGPFGKDIEIWQEDDLLGRTPLTNDGEFDALLPLSGRIRLVVRDLETMTTWEADLG